MPERVQLSIEHRASVNRSAHRMCYVTDEKFGGPLIKQVAAIFLGHNAWTSQHMIAYAVPVASPASWTSVASAAASTVTDASSTLASSAVEPALSTAAAAAASYADERNPLIALFDGLLRVLLASLNLLRILATFSTITVPSLVYTILHYSLTLQLNFPSLALLFLTSVVSAFIWLRYRHLNKYERLREVPITRDEGFNLNPDVASAGGDNDRGSFHNYLDDFLQAIRIFGFLEKPVFHELARHLQTRRLVAGDSLSLDTDCSFYIVIDGHVQVYAPLPSGTASAVGQDSIEDEDDSGYQLLNEVESGGTLSSLFTILSLFTEDVKLSFGSDEDSHIPPHHPAYASMDRHVNPSVGHPLGRAYNGTAPTSPFSSAFNPPTQTAAQLQLNAAALRNVPAAMSTEGAVERLGGSAAVRSASKSGHSRTASSGTESMTVQDGDTSTIMDPHERTDDGVANPLAHAPDLQMPPAQAAAPFSHFAPGYNASPAGTPLSSMPGTASSPYMRGRATSIPGLHEVAGGPNTPGSILSGMSGSVHGHFRQHADPLHRQGAGTVARATVDTTLAVIPAEAFKRLTKKFPNAAAHIVQVILARLSRVTFHTAHKYLGLTKEVMRTEKSINDLACFPLPSEFYEKGGMDKLRRRFAPQPTSRDESNIDDDYFRNFQEWTSTTQRSSTPVPGPRPDGEGSATRSPPKVRIAREQPSIRTSPKRMTTKKAPAPRISTAKTPWGHPDPPLKTPTARTMVSPGDLLSMATVSQDGWHTSGFDVHSAQPTPRARPRSISKLEPFSGPLPHPIDDHTDGASPRSGSSPVPRRNGASDVYNHGEDMDGERPFSNIGLPHFDIKSEVMDCIAKSIGLAQTVHSPVAASYQASPHISAQDSLLQRSVFKSAFSSLSMLDAAMAEEESSITGTNSSMAGHGHSGFHASDFENEVEVKFFPAGSTLVKAGESRAGLFYVIDGFLDVLLPAEANELEEEDRSRLTKDQNSTGKRGSQAGHPGPTGPSSYRSSVSSASLRAGLLDEKTSRDADSSRSQRRGTDADRDSMNDGDHSSSLHRPGLREGSSSSTSYGTTAGLRKRPTESVKVGNALDGTGGAGSSGKRKPSHVSSGSGAAATPRHLDATTSNVPFAAKAPISRPPLQQQQQQPPRGQTSQQTGHRPRDGKRSIFTVGRGGIAGYLSSLLGTASYVDITAKTDAYVGFLPAHALERIMERRPIVLLTLCKRLLSLLPPLILHIDSSLDWQQVNAGQVIYREDDPSDSFFIVINGRLRAITEKKNGIEVHNEYGQGDSVGELDVITNSRRRTTLHAIRDSELAKMPSTLFNAISVRHPAITIQISRIIARRVRTELVRSKQEGAALGAPIPGLPDLGRNNLNLKTVAIVPVTRQVPVIDFAAKLQTAFDDTIGGRAVFLDQSSVMGVLGRHAFSRMGKLKLAGWLADLEQKYRMVVYVVDTPVSSAWSQTSIRQADCVLMVGYGDEPAMGEYERLLMSVKTTARKELVLLHPERSVPPGSTREWLKNRPWVHAHHHVEMPGLSGSHAAAAMSTGGDPKAVKALRNLKQKLETSLQRYRKTKTPLSAAGRPHHASDFARLARRLCGMSIGLVLGGGGARGCAHLGVIRALEERGIPIDMVGGTSIGSLVGGLYAREAEMVSTFGRAKRFAGRMASLWRFASDLTYPVVSYTTGHEFNRGVFKAIQETHIEDMWIPFFCNTTNITWSRMEVHTSGYAWRYIRGSMTLAGLIPPLVDDGNMLVDGGYVDNLPVTVMLAMGARSVFAVDVGSIDDTSPRAYGDTLSGWWVLLNRWNPWSDAGKIPSIPDIQGRLTYVSSVKTLEEAKKVKGCFYMRMPVEEFGTLAFGRFDMIYEKGYRAAVDLLDGWDAEGKLPSGTEREEFEDGEEDDDEYEEYDVYTDDESGVNGGVRKIRRRKRRRRARRKAGISARRNSV
ncbi:potential cyclic nucleotide-binding phospholipase [Pseudozyma hubeiensis SY62]|uniref:Lysophospholipase NTE1 n=1 Tax=Pseudozyma hubeiensis (strain SY62) TaxID=1305764 RepID=R9P700_PSEHS|nr:potential cyclic nucleotide-binding phospholipase [Pseudozyma hubeiensis SY62]GAC97027.1 potential cyclic nucleotide-binding phospholipase [Pseudozyma hubeiensis SY62]